ncbi:MAG: hypothetical protein U0Z44_12335 [Kouleothrix sp.]
MSGHVHPTELIDLPELICPFPSATNPHAAVVEERAIEWGRRFKIITDNRVLHAVRAAKAGWLVAWAYPHAPIEALQLIADWNIWLLIWEDRCSSPELGTQPERLEAIHARFLAILSGAPSTAQDGPLEHGLRDLRERMLAQTTYQWLQQFYQSILEVFDSWVWEATNRARGTKPDLETYLRMRPSTGALPPYLHFLALTDQVFLPRKVHEHPYVYQLTLMANNIICWSNDLFSFDKERHEGELHNLVLILQDHMQLSLQASAQHVAQLHNAEVEAFLNLAAHVHAFSDLNANLNQYVALLRNWIRANMNWAAISGRYNPPMEREVGQ